MPDIRPEYIEKIYAGWLAKIIGIRAGAPIEGWSYERIRETYGELDGYPVEYQKNFAADDDSNGPIFFIRALEDKGDAAPLDSRAVGEAILNYVPFEHGFFWWGGYGVSTEHTAYLNLRSGIPAPQSGSAALNGDTVAEQIGGQIFIDSWGLAAPGNPDLAAEYARKAAHATHDGNGVYGGIFIAVCVSYAFVESDLEAILKKGLSYIPRDCEYTRAVTVVMEYHRAHPEDWRECFRYVQENFGYDRYPGGCHIIPNASVIALSLLYGEGDFDRTINICNMCGWDTDCNTGNAAAIIGVRGGLSAIQYEKWRRPVQDLLICSSVIGSLNISDIPAGASYFAKLAYRAAEQPIPAPWKKILENRPDSCHFEFPGSTHAMRVHGEKAAPVYEMCNTEETAFTGRRSLRVSFRDRPEGRVFLYKKTYYFPEDFDDSRYDPSFSPLVYPGQTVRGSVMIPHLPAGCTVGLYVRDSVSGKILTEGITPAAGEWNSLSLRLPHMDGALIDEAGFFLEGAGNEPLDVFVDDLFFEGTPDYSIDFSASLMEVWNARHREVSQFTRLKGQLYLKDGSLHLSCPDFGEAYTGHHAWEDYTASFSMTPIAGEHHFANVRVQGAIRSYRAGFFAPDRLGLFKNENGYRLLAETAFDWEYGREYVLTAAVHGAEITISVDGRQLLCFTDTDHPYLRGSVGVSVEQGSHCSWRSICVSP